MVVCLLRLGLGKWMMWMFMEEKYYGLGIASFDCIGHPRRRRVWVVSMMKSLKFLHS